MSDSFASPLGSSDHGVSQARILVWVAISSSRRSSGPRDWTCISCIAGRLVYYWDTKEAPYRLLFNAGSWNSLSLCLSTNLSSEYITIDPWEGYLKIQHNLTWPSIPSLKIYPKDKLAENHRYVHRSVYCSTFSNSKNG